MKTSALRQTPRTEDDAFLFAVPALLLAAALALGGLMLMLGALPAEPLPAAAAPESEPLTTFVA
jgi:hypothetical protein